MRRRVTGEMDGEPMEEDRAVRVPKAAQVPGGRAKSMGEPHPSHGTNERVSHRNPPYPRMTQETQAHARDFII